MSTRRLRLVRWFVGPSLTVFVAAACGSETEPADDTSPDAAGERDAAVAKDAADVPGKADASAPRDAGRDAGSLDATVDPDATSEGDAGAQTDGVCTPQAVTTGVFDPDCVYLVGTRLPGSAGWDVLIHPDAPDVQVHGFGDHFGTPVIRPTDGRMVFGTFDELYVFRPDTAALGGGTTSVMLANDDPVLTPGCPQGAARAFVFPDDGAVGYQCFQSVQNPGFSQHLFVEGTTTPLASGGEDNSPIAVGAGRSALFRKGNQLTVFDGANMHPVVGSGVQYEPPTVRFRDGAFLVASVRTYSPQNIELLRISLAGVVTVLGGYQLGVPDTVFNDCRLDPAGALYCFTGQLGSDDRLTRFRLDAPPETLYDPQGHTVALHIPHLVTGP